MCRPIKTTCGWDVYSLYHVKSHRHITVWDRDYLVDLRLVECEDGQSFIVNESSSLVDEKLFELCSEKYQPPFMLNSINEAEEVACKIIAKQTSLEFEELYPYFE
ncbi:hypothetical protein CTT30_22690 (plasmid) [Vibrio coralliilyticus]|nr:hypothetical protein CTT30_22690 [Vibrio coralliilyticus]